MLFVANMLIFDAVMFCAERGERGAYLVHVVFTCHQWRWHLNPQTSRKQDSDL